MRKGRELSWGLHPFYFLRTFAHEELAILKVPSEHIIFGNGQQIFFQPQRKQQYPSPLV